MDDTYLQQIKNYTGAFYRPANPLSDRRLMLGIIRDWRALAENHKLVIVVPTFHRTDFPTTASYNLGNIVGEKGRKNPRSR